MFARVTQMNKSKSVPNRWFFSHIRLLPEDALPVFIASLGGVGKCPFAPATVATAVVGVPFAWLLSFLPAAPALVVVAAVTVLGCYVSELTEKALNKHDPQLVVIDELAGFLVTMVALPATPLSLGVGFAAFRLFDIWKPWPIRALHERFHGGIAIVLDDVGAGIYAQMLTWLGLNIWS